MALLVLCNTGKNQSCPNASHEVVWGE